MLPPQTEKVPPPPGAMFPPINPQINNVISAEVVNEMQCVCGIILQLNLQCYVVQFALSTFQIIIIR